MDMTLPDARRRYCDTCQGSGRDHGARRGAGGLVGAAPSPSTVGPSRVDRRGSRPQGQLRRHDEQRRAQQAVPGATSVGVGVAAAFDEVGTGRDATHFDTSAELLDRYANAAADLAEEDVASVPTRSRSEAVRFVVIGALLLEPVLLEPVLLALRRLAQENASRARFTTS